jgi:hypothetical protein
MNDWRNSHGILCFVTETERPALAHGPPGGLFGIDQEVVTLRGLYGNAGSRRDSTPGGLNPKLTG